MVFVTRWRGLAKTDGEVLEMEARDWLARFLEPGRPFLGKFDHPGWSPGRFDPPTRANDHARDMWALCLDFDGEGGPDAIAQAEACWTGVLGLLHTTRRHTPEVPRVRIVLLFSRSCSAAEHALIWQWAVQRQGLPVDEGTKDAGRFWFEAGSLDPSTYEARLLEGDPLDVDSILRPRAANPGPPPSPDAFTAYQRAAIERACANLRDAATATGNTTLAKEAYALAGLGLPDSVKEELWRACQAWQNTPAEMVNHRRTLDEQWRRGAARPRGEPPPRQAPGPGPAPGGAPGAPPPASEAAPQPSTPHAGTDVPAEWYLTPPPPREWILTDSRTGHGVLPRAKAALLVAEGGAGKTMSFAQLAIAVATGEHWLGTFAIPPTAIGRVLLVLGEEDDEEARRRLYAGVRVMGTLPDAGAITVLGMAGKSCALLCRGPQGNMVETPFFQRLCAQIKAGEYAAVVLDPLSRFSGPDTEKDNFAATEFVAKVEALAATGATIFVGHHSNATSRGAEAASPNSRGVTGITDGFRWVMTLQPEELKHEDADVQKRLGDLVTSARKKSNYSARWEHVTLRRAEGGALVPLDEMDLEIVASARKGSKNGGPTPEVRRAQARIKAQAEVLAYIVANPGCSSRDIRSGRECSKEAALDALNALRQSGAVETRPTGRAGGSEGWFAAYTGGQ